MKIIAIRHGETEGNVQQIVQSHAPGQLTEKGFEQAALVAEKLKNETIDVIYCSDQKRSIDTAQVIAQYHPGAKIIHTKMLCERNLGDLDGQPYDSIPDDLLDGRLRNNPAPGGEAWEDVITRLIDICNQMYERHPGATVLISSHGWTLRVLRALLTDLSLSESLEQHIDNATPMMFVMSEPLNRDIVR